MRFGITLTIIGSVLVLLSIAYLGWALILIPMSEGTVGDWYFIGQVALHGLAPLIPGAIILFFGIERLRSRQ